MIRIKKRLLTLSVLFVAAAFLVLVMKVGHPHHRGWALGCYVGSWVFFLLSLRGKTAFVSAHQKTLRSYLPHALVVLALLGFAYVVRVLVPVEPSPLTEWTPEEFSQEARADAEVLRYLVHGGQLEVDENAWAEQWAETVHRFFELDLIKTRYKGFYQLDYMSRPDQHVGSFLLSYGAFLAQMKLAGDLVSRMPDDEALHTRLNEADPEQGIPENSLLRIQLSLTHPDNLLRLHAGRAYLTVLKNHHSGYEQDVDWITDAYTKLMKQHPLESYVENPLRWLEHQAFEAWFPLQKRVALEMSHVRFTERDYFIQPEQIASLQPRLEPGDILIERRNWHMTNIGIPGFWPHMALYVGSFDESKNYFEKAGLLDEFIQRVGRREGEWAAAKGASYRVIEALRPGVIFTTLEESIHCDHLAVLRPRCTPLEKLQAIENALTFLGRPYDYNFDFATENELVCSELIVKSYAHVTSLKFPVDVVNGRSLLPPNELVKALDQNVDEAQRQFELIAFLDGNEQAGRAEEKSQEEFRRSWKRPKWYVFQNAN